MTVTCTRCKHTYDDCLVDRCLLCGLPPLMLVHSRRENGMRVAQEKVLEFHTKHGFVAGDKPQLLPFAEWRHRYDLMLEELGEYFVAAREGDITEVADALADLLYVVIGTGVAHGINLQPIFDEVHRSNMTKERMDPESKKGGKGPQYSPPRIAELILIQRLRTPETTDVSEVE